MLIAGQTYNLLHYSGVEANRSTFFIKSFIGKGGL